MQKPYHPTVSYTIAVAKPSTLIFILRKFCGFGIEKSSISLAKHSRSYYVVLVIQIPFRGVLGTQQFDQILQSCLSCTQISFVYMLKNLCKKLKKITSKSSLSTNSNRVVLIVVGMKLRNYFL